MLGRKSQNSVDITFPLLPLKGQCTHYTQTKIKNLLKPNKHTSWLGVDGKTSILNLNTSLIPNLQVSFKELKLLKILLCFTVGKPVSATRGGMLLNSNKACHIRELYSTNFLFKLNCKCHIPLLFGEVKRKSSFIVIKFCFKLSTRGP